MKKELNYENYEKKPIWLAYNKKGHEFLCVGGEEPYFEDGKLFFDGEFSMPLPRHTIRNLSKRVKVEDKEKPIRLSRKLMNNVGYARDYKNLIIAKLLREKYGEGCERAGYLLEMQTIEENGKEELK